MLSSGHPLIHALTYTVARCLSDSRDREGAGESFSNQRSEEGAARAAGTGRRCHDAHGEGLCTR